MTHRPNRFLTASQLDGFGARLKALREARLLTQVQLAELSSLTPVMISLFERGRRLPSLPSFAALIRALGDHHYRFLLDLQ